MSALKRTATLLGAVLLVYALLVATHRGEFWPFSIYPMFSQAGQPWSRAVVREVDAAGPVRWQPATEAALPGRPFPLLPRGIDPIDLSNFVSKTETWDAPRAAGLRRMFHDQLDGRALLVMRANGRLTDQDSVTIEFVPYAALHPDSTALNPRLPQ